VAGNVKSAAGNVQQKAGELFGSDEQQAKGAARDASGQAKVRPAHLPLTNLLCWLLCAASTGC
jgi:hypothetical protein